jgi:glycerol-3-phosphate acyltransferase PlsY
MEKAAVILVSYLVGSVSFGIIVSSLRGIDIRSVGSGNTGTSNIMRALGKKDAALVLLGDALKGAGAAAIGALWVGGDFGWVSLFAAVVGHSFPIWHGFRGGKSVATAIGGIAYLVPWVGAVLAVLWIVILLVWKTASIGSLVAMGLLVPLVTLSGASGAAIAWASVIAAFVIVRHASNIKNLVASSERQVNG